MSRSASGRVIVEPSSVASSWASDQLSKPSDSGPMRAYSAGTSRHSTSALFGLVATVNPSIATSSSTNSMPLSAQIAASSSLIARDASEMSASPAQNLANPSPVPGPSTVTASSPPDSSSASSL